MLSIFRKAREAGQAVASNGRACVRRAGHRPTPVAPVVPARPRGGRSARPDRRHQQGRRQPGAGGERPGAAAPGGGARAGGDRRPHARRSRRRGARAPGREGVGRRGRRHRRDAAPRGRRRRADHADRAADAARRLQRQRRGQARRRGGTRLRRRGRCREGPGREGRDVLEGHHGHRGPLDSRVEALARDIRAGRAAGQRMRRAKAPCTARSPRWKRASPASAAPRSRAAACATA